MHGSADILIHNVLGLGSALVLVLVAGVAFSRAALALLVPLSRRLDPSGALSARWRGRLTRVVTLVATFTCLLLLGGVLVLTWYEQDIGEPAWRWALGLLSDPAGAAWLLAQVVGVLVAGGLIYLVAAGLLRLAAEGLGRVLDQARHGARVERLIERLRVALRWALACGVALVALRVVPSAEAARYPLEVLAVVAVGFSVSRGLVGSAHLLVDVVHEAASTRSERGLVFLYASRLGRLIPVTKKVLEYILYGAAATLVVEQLTPDTPLAALGLAAIRVIGILYVTQVVVEVCALFIREALAPPEAEVEATARHQRATLVPVAIGLTRYGAYIVGIAMALGELGLDTTPVLAAAGLLGIAVGLGAQAIVGDLVSGFFILFEGLFLVGHRVRIGEVEGFVEELGVRVTKVRDEAGVLHHIPNGEIRAVASASCDHVNSVVEFSLPYSVDLPGAFASIREHFAAIRPSYGDIVGPTELVVHDLHPCHIVARAVTRVKPGKDDEMNEALRLEVLAALVAARISTAHACAAWPRASGR